MKKTQSNFRGKLGARSPKLCAAFLVFLAACSPIPSWGQQSTARLSALTPSVFQSQAVQGNNAGRNSMQPNVGQAAYAQPTPAAASPASYSQPAPAAAATPAIHSLQYISGENLTQKMVVGFGDKLQASVPNGIVKIQLEPSAAPNRLQPAGIAAAAPCELLIDRATNRYALEGSAASVASWTKVIQQLDSLEGKLGSMQLMVCAQTSGPRLASQLTNSGAEVTQLAPLVYKVGLRPTGSIRPVGFQDQQEGSVEQPAASAENADVQDDVVTDDNTMALPSGLKIIVSENGRVVIFEGTDEEIRQGRELLQRLQEVSEQSKPDFDTLPLQNANNQNLAPVLQQLYNESFAPTLGPANISAVPGENSLVVSGSRDAINEIRRLVTTLDVESDVTGSFKVLHPRYISASSAANRLGSYFNAAAAQPGANVAGQNNQTVQPVLIIPDPRSNSIILKAGTLELAQAELLLKEIDIVDSPDVPVFDIKTIQLRNSVASDMAQVIQAAINGQVANAPTATTFGNNAGNFFGGGNFGGNNQQTADPTPAATGLRLKLMSIDDETGVIKSGILFDIQITADATSNSLIIRGPEESLPLVEALIKQLDRLPDAKSNLKVFTIVNGDAQQLYDMLSQLFQQNQQQGGGGFNFGGNQNSGISQLPVQTGASVQTLVSLRFTLEPRTNSIIASGSEGDLQVVEDLLTLLDRESSTRFIHKLVRLSNLPADDMANALNTWIENRSSVIYNADPATAAENVAVRQQIVVTPEPISNTLMITASPENMIETLEQIRKLDRRPPMVEIKVMIAEVTLGDTEEFGIQMGVQDSMLFDRGLGSGIGYNFNQTNIGNSLDATGLASREQVAGQGLVNLGLGRSSTLGYGGLVLSAGNESINVLLRALKDKQRVRTLSRPVLMTIDNLQARVQVGQQVPYVSGVSQNTVGGFQNQVELKDIGVILDVVPRVSPDGMITMLVNAQNSSLGAEADGTQIGVDANGGAVRQRPINIQLAVTTVLARSGQTVVLGGLIRDQKTYAKRGVPYLSDLPRLGPLFSFKTETELRTELLFFLTPTIIEDDTELACTNQAEFDRMNWCLEDVIDMNGPMGVTDQGSFYNDSAPVVVYPDIQPTGPGVPAIISRGQGLEDTLGQYEMMNFNAPVANDCEVVPNANPLIPAPINMPDAGQIPNAAGLKQ